MGYFWTTILTQVPVLGGEVDAVSRTIERGGWAAICAILLGAVALLYVSKEKQATRILLMVEKQTEVLTRQQISSEKVAEALAGIKGVSEKLVDELNRARNQ